MADPIKRLNYFNGQFLRAPDFTDDQRYHLEQQRDHMRLMHTAGIATGLEVPTPAAGASSVTVNSGIAFDARGQRIVLANDLPLELGNQPADQTVYVTISYGESQTDPVEETGISGNTRWTEAPLIEVSSSAPGNPLEKLVLARIDRVGTKIGEIYLDDRLAAGVKGGDLEVRKLTLTSESIAPAGWVTAELGASKRADFDGSLRVTGDLLVTGSIQGNIAVNTIETGDLLDGAVTNAKLANNSVNAAKIVDGSIGTAELADGAVALAKLANNSVDASKIVDGSVGSVELANAAVVNAKLADGSVTTTKLVDANVTTAKLADGSVTTAKLASAMQPIVNGVLSSNLQVSGNVGINAPPVHRLYIVAGDEPDNQTNGVVAQVSTGSSATFTQGISANVSSSGNGPVSGSSVTTAGDGTGQKTGLFSNVYGADGPKYAAQFNASTSGATSNAMTQALYAYATSSGTGPVIGLTLDALSNGAGQKTGLQCSAYGEDGAKFAGQFYASTSLNTSNALTQGIAAQASTNGTGMAQALSAQAVAAGTGVAQGLQVGAYGDGAGEKQGLLSTAQGGGGTKRAGSFTAYTTLDTSSAYTEGLTAYAQTSGTGVATGISIGAHAVGNGHSNAISANVTAAGSGSTTGFSASVSSAGAGNATGFSLSASGSGTGPKYGITASVSGADGAKRTCQLVASTSSSTSSANTEALWIQASSAGTGEVMGTRVAASTTGNGAVYGALFLASSNGTGPVYGVYANVGGTGSGTKYAGYFSGNVHVNGTLSKSGGTFLIDHPLDPYNRVLRHNFVESPEELCLYRGSATLDGTGKVVVKMPDYFPALTKEEEATITLTPIGKKPFLTSYEWNKKCTAFTIYGDADRQVSYLVLATRDDPTAHLLRRPIEEDKTEAEKGKLLVPAAYDQPEEKGVAAVAAVSAPARERTMETQMRSTPKEIEERHEEYRAEQERLARERKAHEQQHQRMMAEHEKHEQARTKKESAFQAQGRKPA